MMTTVSTKSNACCGEHAPMVIAGVVVVAGVALVLWLLLSHQTTHVDPQAEIDRRISDLEHSLSHLHDAIGHTTGG